MHFKKTLSAAVFCFGAASVMARCGNVKLHLIEERDGGRSLVAVGLSGGQLVETPYSTQGRLESFGLLLHEICSDFQYCADNPRVADACFDQGGDIVYKYQNQDSQSIATAIEGFVNNLVARDLSMPPTLDYDEKMQLDNDLRENTFTEEDFVPDYY